MPLTIDGSIRWWGAERADQLALVQGSDGVTYGELNAWVGRVAADFARRGLSVGDRVCIYAGNRLEWCVAALATLRAGGIVAGINAKMVPAEVAYLLGDYAPTLVVVDAECAKSLAQIGALTSRHGAPVAAPQSVDLSEISAVRKGEAVDIRREVDPAAPCMIVTTSGSTARPKGVMYSNTSMIAHISAFIIEEAVDVQPVKMLIVAPFNTSAGGMVFIHSLVQGGVGYFDTQFDPEWALDLIERERITIFCSAPIFLQRVAACPRFPEADLSCIKVSFTGGATVPMKLLQDWASKGVTLRQMFGQTECGGWGVTNPHRYAFTHPDRCGWGGPNRDIGIIDADGKFLPPGQQGQIVMRGPGQMLGYWNNPEATAETLVDGWIRTGDIGVIDELGLLKYIDRAKDIIISGGLNISAAEIERVIVEHPGVEEAAVLAAPDEKFGETPLAVVYGPGAISIAALIEHCGVNLSSHKVPRYVVISRESLPRLPTGKISKPLLREQHINGKALPPKVR